MQRLEKKQDPMPMLVVGGNSSVGTALAGSLRDHGHVVISTTRRPSDVDVYRLFLDLASDLSAWTPPASVSHAFLCAAIGSLADCARDPEATARVNVDNTVKIASALIQRGAFVVFLSTNMVFDGSQPYRKPNDQPRPQGEYGRQKARAEQRLLELGPSVAIVRFTKIVPPNFPLFTTWYDELKAGQPVHPFANKVIAPVPMTTAVAALERVAELRLPGITQVSGLRDATYAEVAAHIAQRIAASPLLVQPVLGNHDSNTSDSFPAHTTLDTTRLAKECGITVPDIWETVDSNLDIA